MGLDLAVENLKWAFPGSQTPFLEVPSLKIPAGKLVALVGPSGAGKSTLLYLLAGLELPSEGVVLWDGYSPAQDRPVGRDRWRRKNLGLVFQDFQLVPDLTALENVLLPLTFARFSVPRADRARARVLLERLGIERPEARVSTLSRGEMQRTALARTLLSRPPVVLADEPTASLDAANETVVTELLASLTREEGITVIASTHHPALVSLASQIVHLDHGRVKEAV